MSQSILNKIRTLFSANTHSIIDQALDKNSIGVLDQYIRQTEDNLNELEEALVTAKAQVKTFKRKYETCQREADELDKQIDQLLEVGKEDLAMVAQSDYNVKFDLAQEYRQQYIRQKGEADKLADARLKLQARLQSIRREREHVLGLLELAKTKEIAARSMKSLDALEGVGDADISGIAERIRGRLDRADAEIEMRTERLSSRMDDVLEKDKLSGQLEERRRRLAIRQAKQEAAEESTNDMLSKS